MNDQYKTIKKLDIDKDTIVCYQGVPGAFSEEATVAFFGEDIKRVNVKSFEDVLTTLEEGRADFGVLPIENSSAGFVSGSYDLLLNHDVSIVGEKIIDIEQCLLALKGATTDDIKTVYSHPQGLLQSRDYLEQYPWQQIAFANTAMAAKKIRDDGMKDQAAIAGKRAAALYGLEILKEGINYSDENATRFVILSAKKVYLEDAKKITICFSLPHKSGTLYGMLGHFIENDLNMTSIESSPRKDSSWEYNFFITFDGNLSEENTKKGLEAIKKDSLDYKLLGNY